MMRWLLIILVLLAAPAVGQPRRTFTQDDLRQAEVARDAALARVKALEQASSVAARAVSDIDADLDLGPAPVQTPAIDPETVLPSEEENANFYARTGVWQRPPVITLPDPEPVLEEVISLTLHLVQLHRTHPTH
jgi:hypothetical protein